MGSLGEIIRVAANQGGFVARDQLFDLGLSSSAIARRVKAGELTNVADGVYQLYPVTSHLDLMRGAVVALPAAVVSHQSAASLLDLPRVPELVPTVTVASHTTHRFLDVVVRRNNDLAESHRVTVHRLPVTSVARTVFDLAAVLRYREFVKVAEAAILGWRMEMVDLEDLLAELGRKGKTGTQAVRDFVTERAGVPVGSSPLETRGRKVILDSGLPTPESEYPIPWSPTRRWDDAYPSAKLAVEWDSRGWHAQQEAMATDRQRDRDAALHGWLILRFTWNDVTQDPAGVIATIGEMLERRSAPF